LTLPSTVIAIVLLVVGLVVATLDLQSQNRVYWTGASVTGTVQGGIIFYRVQGQQYTLDDPVTQPNGAKVAVFYDHQDPSVALSNRPVRWIEGGAVLFWFVAAVALLIGAALHRTRDARRRRLDPRRQIQW
jgi:hypothetical protein